MGRIADSPQSDAVPTGLRLDAAMVLARNGQPAALRRLVATADVDLIDHYGKALGVLENVGAADGARTAASAALRQLAGDPDVPPFYQGDALRMLGYLERGHAAPFLRARADDPDAHLETRQAALAALATIQSIRDVAAVARHPVGRYQVRANLRRAARRSLQTLTDLDESPAGVRRAAGGGRRSTRSGRNVAGSPGRCR